MDATTGSNGQAGDPWGDLLALPWADIFAAVRAPDQEPDAEGAPDYAEPEVSGADPEPADLWLSGLPTGTTSTSTSNTTDDQYAWAIARKPWIANATRLAEWTIERCVNRTDAWGEYKAVGKREKGNSFTAKETDKRQLDKRRLERHFRSLKETDIVGLHTTSPDNSSLWGAVEIDLHDDNPDELTPGQILTYALHLLAKLKALGFRSILLTDSNGKGGLHLRIFFARPVPTARLHSWLQSLVADHAEFGLKTAPETFPKQAGVDPDRPYGNWLRLPGRHHTRRHLSRVWDGAGWLDGAEAIELIIAIKGDDPALMPIIEPAEPAMSHDTEWNGPSHRLLVATWLRDRGYACNLKDGTNRSIFILERCPFDATHGKNNEVAVFQDADGKLGFLCMHNHCSGFGWQEAKKAIGEPDPEHYDPPMRRRERQTEQPSMPVTDSDGNEPTRPPIRNWIEVDEEDDNESDEAEKKKTTITVPLPMSEVLKTVKAATDDWPRRVGGWLFADEGTGTPTWLEKSTTTFGYLGGKTGVIKWRNGIGYTTKEEVHERLKAAATSYRAVEVFPHWPAIKGHYYCCETPRAGNGATLQELLDRFSPATPIDRDLLLAAVVTPGWGGLPGCRPAFLITADGRGAGKSKMAAMIARLWGEALDFHYGEDLAEIKQRLLSPEGLTRRVALLDNIKTLRFSWAELESLITNPTISGKRMYVGEGSRPNLLTWFLTLNGASMSTDMAQRVVIIVIRRPTYSGDWEGDIIRFVDQHREQLLADVAAYFGGDRFQLARYTRWGTWEHEVLARLPDPAEAQRVIVERQEEVDVEQDEFAAIEEFVEDQLERLSYDPAADVVFIPSAIGLGWIRDAFGDRTVTTTKAKTKVEQGVKEGRLRRLDIPGRSYGRGYRWTGEAAGEAPMRTDLRERVARREQQK